MAGDVFVLLKICCVRDAWLASKYALRTTRYVHTCESGSMAASDDLLPSLPLLFCVSFDCAVGEVGPRRLATSLPLVTVGLEISIDAEDVKISDAHPLLCWYVFLRRVYLAGFQHERVGLSL